MNGVRMAITVFLLAILALVVLGWQWTEAHQPAPKSAASHVVLAISGLSGLGALISIWRHGPSRGGRPRRS